MKCVNCGRKYYIERKFAELFIQKRSFLCDLCYKKYSIELERIEIPLEKYTCEVLTIFQRRYFIDYNYFIFEYNQILKRFFYNREYQFIFLDYLDLNDSTIEILNGISKLFEKNLFLLVFAVKK